MNSQNQPPGGNGSGLRGPRPPLSSAGAGRPVAGTQPGARPAPASPAANRQASRIPGPQPGSAAAAPAPAASVLAGRHRVAPGLAPQPQPVSGATASTRPAAPPSAARQAPATPTSASVAAAAASISAPRAVAAAADAYPPMSSRPGDSLGASLMDQKRITPRSPRAALEPEQVAVPTRRSKRTRNPLVIVGNAIFTLLILVVIGVGVAIMFGKQRFEAPGPLEQEKVVNIPARLGILDIAELLRREGVLDEHAVIFVGGVVALKARAELKSGEYLFPKHASVRDIVETMVEGKVIQHLVTIPEGLTSEQIVARLLDSDILTGNVRELPREGSMLPDSYSFNRGYTRDQAIQRMQQAQQRIVRDVWERRNRDVPLKSPEQLVILASIIEKETSKPEERTRIAAVFANRLKQRMKLQSDPTIIYGLVRGKGALGRPITRADIDRPNEYNTYVIDGLPPGPIANPGRASIEAAANPARTKELYFVADGAGGHAFAETYEQHQKNVGRFRVFEQEQRQDQRQEQRETQAAPDARPLPAPPPQRAPAKQRRSATSPAKNAK